MDTSKIRQAAVAGKFYPSSVEDLKIQINSLLQEGRKTNKNRKVGSLVVPHAGYPFSGKVAASAYKQVQGEFRKTVVLMCNSHTSFFEGVAVSDSDLWRSPLGDVAVAQDLAQDLISRNINVFSKDILHEQDHTLEVQLPFLQRVLDPGFKILPLLFGNTGGDEYLSLAEALTDILEKNDLVIASTDLSHFPPYEEANRIDKRTLDILKDKNIEELEEHISEVMEQGVPGEETLICGLDGVKTVMKIAELLDQDKGEFLQYTNSGDADSSLRDSVVGYGAVAFYQNETGVEKRSSKGAEAGKKEESGDLDQDEKKFLADIAKKTVERYVLEKQLPDFEVRNKKLQEPRGVFVSIKKGEELRGCIGRIVQSDHPLWKEVQNMALAAATKDDRFPPVRPEELTELKFEVSVLSLPEPVFDWRDIEPGKHGVIVRKKDKSGVFLPEVAEQFNRDLEEFLSQLCWQKAGLLPDSYKNDPDLEIYTFATQNFSSEKV